MLNHTQRTRIPNPNTFENRQRLSNNTSAVNTAVLNEWGKSTREVETLVLFYNISGEIIYDTEPVNNYTALIETEIDTQKTALFGTHAASGYVKVYTPYLHKHDTNSAGETITDYEIVKWLTLYKINTSITAGGVTVNFADYTPTQYMYVSGTERENSSDTIKYIGYDWLEYQTNDWASYIESIGNSNITLQSLCQYVNTIGATIGAWNSDLYTQELLQDNMNFSGSQTTTLRSVLDSFGEAYGCDIISNVTVSNNYEIKDNTYGEHITIKSHNVRNGYNHIPANSVYNFKNYGDNNSVRINAIHIYNNLGNKMTYTAQNLPTISQPHVDKTYHIYNNPVLMLQPYERLVTETTTQVPFTLSEYAQKTVGNTQYRSMSDALYYPCSFSYTAIPIIEVGDPIRIEWNGVYYYTMYCGGCTKYNGGLRCEVDLYFINDIFSDDNSKDTVGSAVNRLEANIDYNNNRIELLNTRVPDNLGEIISKVDLQLNEEDIKSIVSRETKDSFDEITGDIRTLKSETEVLQDAEKWSVKVNSCVNSVRTTEGMTFDNTGLNITRTGSSTYTNINDTGLHVKQSYGNNNEMLTADANGVYANTLTIDNGAVIGNFKIINSGNKIAFYFLG